MDIGGETGKEGYEVDDEEGRVLDGMMSRGRNGVAGDVFDDAAAAAADDADDDGDAFWDFVLTIQSPLTWRPTWKPSQACNTWRILPG